MPKVQSSIYELPESGGKSIQKALSQMIYLRAIATGTITALTIYLATPLAPFHYNGATAEAVWNVRKNGTALFTGGDKPQMSIGNTGVAKTGLSVSITKGDVLCVDLESIDGRAGTMVVFVMDVN